MRRQILFIVTLGALVSGCAGDASRPTAARSPAASPTPSATPTWAGYPKLAEGSGEISVTEFNDFVEQTSPPWSTLPLHAAIEFIYGGTDPSKEQLPLTTTLIQKTNAEAGTEANVTLVSDGIWDDSTAAIRYRLAFRQENDGTWRLVSAFTDHRCARGPDTKNFTTEPCI